MHLPLDEAPFRVDDPDSGLPAVVQDSLPDAWGRAMLTRRYRLPLAEQVPVRLLECLGVEAMGALACTNSPEIPAPPAVAPMSSLTDLAAAVEAFERDPVAVDQRFASLFASGSPAGGARPKAVIREGDRLLLAKFPSRRDDCDVVGLEAATLACARDAGLDVPDFRVEAVGSRRALLIERFDVTPAGGRRHMVSMQTLLGATGYDLLGYRDAIERVREVSDDPAADLTAILRQALFNAAIGNTDDHLKNFTLLRDARGWRLSPAYDLLPDIAGQREHVLYYRHPGQVPSRADLRWLGEASGFSRRAVDGLLAQVLDAVDGWASHAAAYGVPKDDIVHFDRSLPALAYQ